MIQPLPQCPEEDLDALQARAEGIKAMAGMLDDGMELEAALAQLFQGLPWRQTQWLTPGIPVRL